MEVFRARISRKMNKIIMQTEDFTIEAIEDLIFYKYHNDDLQFTVEAYGDLVVDVWVDLAGGEADKTVDVRTGECDLVITEDGEIIIDEI